MTFNRNEKNITVVIPVFNDWKSLNKLLKELNNQFKNLIVKQLNILIIDDASEKKEIIKINKLIKIDKIKIIKLKYNQGNQKAILVGLHYLNKINYKGTIIVMDSDGEDDPKKIKLLLNSLEKNKKYFIVASRKKRTENKILRSLNMIRLIITLILTGKFINFGNYSCFISKNLKKIIKDQSLKLAYCSTLQRNDIKKIYINKKKRYYGKSKANLKFLLQHSINIISVFYKNSIINSFFLSLVLFITINKNYLFFLIPLIGINFILFLNYLNSKNFKKIEIQKIIRIK